MSDPSAERDASGVMSADELRTPCVETFNDRAGRRDLMSAGSLSGPRSGPGRRRARQDERLGLQTIVEGIGEAAQLSWFRRERVDVGRGFLFSELVEAAVVNATFDGQSRARNDGTPGGSAAARSDLLEATR